MILYQFGAIIADIALISILVISILAGFRKGFAILVFDCIAWLVTIIAVIALFKPVTTFVCDKTGADEFFSKHIKTTIGDFVEEQLANSEHINTSKTNIARPIAEKINTYIDEAKNDSVDSFSSYIADKLSYIVIAAIVVIVLCIVIRIAAICLKSLLYFITDLPFIHSIDKVGGTIYGVLRGFFLVYLILAILSLISPLIADSGIIAAINHSKVCKIFYNNNLFLKIIM